MVEWRVDLTSVCCVWVVLVLRLSVAFSFCFWVTISGLGTAVTLTDWCGVLGCSLVWRWLGVLASSFSVVIFRQNLLASCDCLDLYMDLRADVSQPGPRVDPTVHAGVPASCMRRCRKSRPPTAGECLRGAAQLPDRHVTSVVSAADTLR